MAEFSFPHDAVEDEDGELDRIYFAEDWKRMLQRYFTNGIFANPSTGLQVESLNNNMVVTVQPGYGHVNGCTYTSDEILEFALNTANANYNRIDLIVLQLNETERKMITVYKQGIAAGKPIPPELIRNSDIWELKLAQITVRSGTQVILQSDILDTRLDNAVCGFVSSAVTTVDTSTLFAEYAAKWAEVQATMKANEAAYNAWYDLFQATADADMARINQDFADKMEEIDDWEQAEIARFVQMYKDNQAEFDALLITIKAAADARLQEQYDLWSSKMADYDAWYTSIKTSIFDSKYFDFNNNIYRAGHEYSYTETQEPHIFVETIKNSVSGDIYAIRTSEESASGDWTIRTVCTEQSINMIEQWLKQPDGTWKGVFNRA